jgi:hypothetical protein
MNKKMVWSYLGEFKIPPPSDKLKNEHEIQKYKALLKEMEKLEKTLKSGEKTQSVPITEMKEDVKHLLSIYDSWRTTLFESEEGEVFPKDVPPPEIILIQYPEPHIRITDLYQNEADWYGLQELIPEFANQAFVCYELGLWHASIASAINCCEYILKYEYLRSVERNEADKLAADKSFSLGTFNQIAYLNKLNLAEFKNKIDDLNTVRIALYHFSPSKIKKIKEKGEGLAEREAEFHDEIVLPRISYRIYTAMTELINRFYNKTKALQYLRESAEDWKKLRGYTDENLSLTS